MRIAEVVTARRAAAAAVVALGAAVATGCGGGVEEGASTGGPWMTMSVAVCVAEDADVPRSAAVEVRQDGDVVGAAGDSAGRPTWFEVSTRSGVVQVVADGEVLEERTGRARGPARDRPRRLHPAAA
ncbi:hypothetical protein [uncultured Pseudokineococcus sp.]|uniref:hypothetical protein n=1 Tax=uncultured Pseudokineococcus sp. TaxID=1642928 RepID=UPI00261BA2F5|nr:hypothetical protein [uncultured Pseudokineococcus sp.]